LIGMVLLSLGGCTSANLIPGTTLPDGNATIYVVERGWHTDIALPADQVSGPLASLERDFPGVRFIVFGFGERAYLMARNGGSGEMLGALFPSTSALLVTALRAPPTEAFADQQVVALRLPRSGIDRIATLIWQSLETNADGSAVRLADGPYAGSLFYASRETYDAFNTCNTWTAQILHDGGFPLDPRGILFAGQVMRQVRQIATLQAEQSH
jgi:uncharacterized protein (TIGR02117 family)